MFYQHATRGFEIIVEYVQDYYYYFFVFAFSWAAPAAYGGSQAPYGVQWSCSHRPRPEPQQLGIRAASAIYTTAHGNAGSLTHWARAGTEPATSWFLVGFVNHFATTWTPSLNFLKAHLNSLSQSSPEIMSWFKGW